MPISFCCPHCGVDYRVSRKYAGRATRCPKCSNRFRIPKVEIPYALPPVRCLPQEVNQVEDFIEKVEAAQEEEYVDYEIKVQQRRKAMLVGCLSAVPFFLFVIGYLAYKSYHVLKQTWVL